MRNHYFAGEVLFIVIVLITAASQTAWAATRFSLVGSRPAPEGGSFFTVTESATLPRLNWSAGTAFNYGYQPLKAVLGTADFNIVKDQLDEHFYGAVGITDRLQLSADMPVIWENHFSNPDTLSAAPVETGVGDLLLAAKFNLLDRNRHGIGVGVFPWVTLPTGNEGFFMGDDGVTGGGRLIVDGQIGKRITVATNMGVLARKTFNAYALKFGSQFLISAGVNIAATKTVSAVGEIETSTPLDDFFQSKSTSPTQGRAGLQWRIGQTCVMNAAGTYGIISGSALPHYGALLGLTYHPKISQAAGLQIKPEKIEQVFYFDYRSAKITPETANKLDAITRLLVTRPDITKLTIDGYTDSTGTKRNNRKMGRWRAGTIRKYLIHQGNYQGTFELRDHGEKDPAATNKTREGQVLNRRAEIHSP